MLRYERLVHPDFHWPNIFATIFVSFTDENSQNLHAILCYRLATSTWRGFTKRVSVVPLLLLVSETGREIVTFLGPYIFTKQTTSDGHESILSV